MQAIMPAINAWWAFCGHGKPMLDARICCHRERENAIVTAVLGKSVFGVKLRKL